MLWNGKRRQTLLVERKKGRRRWTAGALACILTFCATVVPIQAAETDNPAISADRLLRTFYVNDEGTLWAWGNNLKGVIDPEHPSMEVGPTKIGENVRTVSGFLVLKEDGAVYEMDEDAFYRQTKVMDNVVAIDGDTTYNVNLALDNKGNLYSWGVNYRGALGFEGGEELIPGENVGGTPYGWKQYTPHKILDNVQDFCVVGYGGCAVKKDGTVWAWGESAPYQLGAKDDEGDSVYSWFSESYKYYTNPVQVMSGVKTIICDRGGVSAIIKPDGSIWTKYTVPPDPWDDSNTSYEWSKRLDHVVDAASFNDGVLCLKDDGTVWGWGKATGIGVKGDTEVGSGMGFFSSDGYVPDLDRYQSVPVKLMTDVAAIGEGVGLYIVKKDGTVWETVSVGEDSQQYGTWKEFALSE